MNWLVDFLFWVLLIIDVFSGCYGVASAVGWLVGKLTPGIATLLPKLVLAWSALLTPAALVGVATLLKEK